MDSLKIAAIQTRPGAGLGVDALRMCGWRPRTRKIPTARLAVSIDLASLLALFSVSEVSRAVEPRERAERVSQETLAEPGVRVFVSDEGERIAATCMLITAPSLLRSGRRHGFLETSSPTPTSKNVGMAVPLS